MARTFREVVCGYCEHRFMWDKDNRLYDQYRRVDGSIGLVAKCPNCGKKLVVFDDSIKALPIELNENIKRVPEIPL